MEVKIETTEIQGHRMALFFVNKNDPRLGPQYMGGSVEEVFSLVEETDLGGLVVYNDRVSYFGIMRAAIPSLRREYLKAASPI
jgi:hypothetical protein